MVDEIEYYSENRAGRDFFVGDIHGCYAQFTKKLQELRFDPDNDRVFSVGDLVDRGLESRKCLALVDEPWFHAVWGNHEEMMWHALEGSDETMWLVNGGNWSLFENRQVIREELARARDKMPLAMEIESRGARFGVIHADVTSGVWGDFCRERDLWSRSRISGKLSGEVSGIDLVVVGHTVVDSPTRVSNVVYIDTGAYMEGNLQVLKAGELLSIGG